MSFGLGCQNLRCKIIPKPIARFEINFAKINCESNNLFQLRFSEIFIWVVFFELFLGILGDPKPCLGLFLDTQNDMHA